MQKIIPKLNAEWQIIAPKIEPEYFLNTKNSTLTKNILNTQINVGVARKSQRLLMNTIPKCEICVRENAKLSTTDAFLANRANYHTGQCHNRK